MKIRLRYFWVLLALLALSVGVLGGVALDREVLVASAHTDTDANTGPDWNLMTQAWSTIQRFYVDRSALVAQHLTYGAISGMVDALGDTGHSSFLTPQMVQQEKNYTQGQFEGIGAEVSKKGNQIVIVAPLDDSPAQRAGLHAGDVILKVDGTDVSGMEVEDVIGKVLGPAGTAVTLTILDSKTGEIRDVTLVRARIVVHNVTWQRVPGTAIADVRMMGFSENVSNDLKNALAEIKQQQFTGIILDLRNNPGGLLGEAVTTTSQFVSSGNALLEKDAQGKLTPIPVEPNTDVTDLPMVVLINYGTASAAEIVSGALQDHQRATLVGETTFGTGTVLSQFPLPDGSALLLATQEWLTPNGRVIWHHGITPDTIVTLGVSETLMTPEAEKDMTPDQVRASSDAQFKSALDILSPHTINHNSRRDE